MRLKIVGAIAVILSLALPARAADFTPETSFRLRPAKVNRYAALTIRVAQEAGEEELASVKLSIPAGFRLPRDTQISQGEELGDGIITISTGPNCPEGSGTLATDVPVRIVERDRTNEQATSGVHAVWRVDIQTVTRIDLEIRGSAKKGWTLAGPVPGNDLTCPPFAFVATIEERSSGGTGIIRTPRDPGGYTFRAMFKGVDDSTYKESQRIKIKR
jgi:hypothetical protein